MQGTNTIIVASSDLSHYHPYDDAVRIDHKTLKAIEEWDYLSMSRNFEAQIWEACGGGPIIATMIASERLGASQAQLLKYANSGDATGDRSRVVGYGAMAIHGGPRQSPAADAPFTLGPAEKDELFRIARGSVESAVRNRKLLDYSGSKLEALNRERGAFVTLKIKGDLRGCVGYVSPTKPLALTVRDVAASAAVEDTRFRPVPVQELASLEYEISVLSPMRRVLDVKDVKVGRDGLVMLQGRYQGLLLPQVPTEQGWDRITFLNQTCAKAGLPEDCWGDDRTDVFSFTALVLDESQPKPAAPASNTPRP